MTVFTCIFVFITVVVSGIATLLLSISLLSNEWEFLSYRVEGVMEISRANNHSLMWMDQGLGRVEIFDKTGKTKILYLVPAFGGIHRLCTNMSDTSRIQMKFDGYNVEDCISYLANEKLVSKDGWMDRMRNLAMSCAIVCLILIGFSAPLGTIALFKRQISTIMVTGVMYILAGVFGIFNLTFMHFKRAKPDGHYTSTILDLHLPEDYMKERQFIVGWPISAEWAGLCLCMLCSLFWLILAKIYRFQVLSPV